MRRTVRTLSLIGAATALALGMSVPANADTEPSTKAFPPCWVNAHAPLYSSPDIYATGSWSCFSAVDKAEMEVEVWRDGRIVGRSNTTWTRDTAAQDTALARNIAGNQRWCTNVGVTFTYNGQQQSGSDFACETAGF
ncbi:MULTISPECIES: hypothetical protein [Streptomyces]|uniref:hypothetical protein n=1 Tax=Streptomyces TaxID=1883 RepID=UPI000F65853A|nr:hypothetical protein [Streptomyces alboflavus]